MQKKTPFAPLFLHLSSLSLFSTQGLCAFFLLISVFFLCTGEATALTLRRNLPTSARDMEYYYTHKKTEVIPGLLRSFDAEKRFARGELKLVTAAFLSEIFKADTECAKRVLALAPSMSAECRAMFLWAGHLTNNPRLDAFIVSLGLTPDAGLKAHLAHSPRDLKAYDICRSSAALHMYWGAYFATGSTRFIDPMIEAVIVLGKLKAQGLTKDPRFSGAMDVAATLFEMSPRHKGVAKRIAEYAKNLSGPEREPLELILQAK